MVEAIGHGRFLVSLDGRKQLAYGVADRDRAWVFIDGHTYVVASRESPQRGAVGLVDERLALSAPMPATVIAVNTAVGREVGEGDTVIVLEAMKMELPIAAPRAGRVKAVLCRPGELVQPGEPLLELE